MQFALMGHGTVAPQIEALEPECWGVSWGVAYLNTRNLLIYMNIKGSYWCRREEPTYSSDTTQLLTCRAIWRH